MAATGSVARRISRGSGHPGKLVIADATSWPGVPIAGWAPADLSVDYAPPRGRGIQAIPVDTPLACWLPIKPGLTVHGLSHGRKTWMAEDGIPLRNRLPPSRQGDNGLPPVTPLYCLRWSVDLVAAELVCPRQCAEGLETCEEAVPH
jgi:hypothetical protein